MAQHRIVTNITHHLKQRGGLKEHSQFLVEAKIGGGKKKVVVKFVHDDHRNKHRTRLEELAKLEEFEIEFQELAA